MLEREGFAVFDGALDPGRVDTLERAVDRVYRASVGDGALHLLGFVGLDRAFLELVDHYETVELVCERLGWNIYVYHCHLDVHPPLSSAPPPVWRWHQDGGRQNVELDAPRPLLSLKIAYFLTDVACPEDGALWVLPGSHRRDRLARPANGSTRPAGATPLLVSAGTAVVFDRRLWHARGDNVGPRTRKALFYGYTHRWIRPRDELLEVDQALLDELDPVRKQLLGYGTSSIGYWIPTGDDVPLAMRYKTPRCEFTSSATWRASPGS